MNLMMSIRRAIWLALLLFQPPCLEAVEYVQPRQQPNAEKLEPPKFTPKEPGAGFVLPPVPEIVAEPSKDQRKFAIKRVAFHGQSVFPESELHTLVADLEGRAVNVAEIEASRQALTRYYIDHGYINSGAVISADAFRDGILSIEIREGGFEDVRVEGHERLRPGYIKNRLRRAADETLHVPTLQDRFQLLLTDPLIQRMNGRILPGSRPGLAILDLDIVRARPYHLSLFGDNYRPPSIGAEVFGVNGWVRNLTGLGDTMDFAFTTGEGTTRYTGGFKLPVSDRDTEVYFRFDEGDSSVIEEPVRNLNIKSRVHILQGGVRHPFINSPRQRLSLGLQFDVKENETALGGIPFSFVAGETTGRNQVTVLRFFNDYLRRWDDHVIALRSTFSFGLDALGATRRRSVLTPGGEFFAWLGQVQYAHKLSPNGTQAVVRGAVQITDSSLLPLERFAVGGVGTVRGYRENEVVRDEGYDVTAEIQIPLLTGANRNDRLQLIPFVDYGEAWNLNQASNALFSVGVGLSGDYRVFHAELYYGYALNRPVSSSQDDLQDHGIHFQARFDAF